MQFYVMLRTKKREAVLRRAEDEGWMQFFVMLRTKKGVQFYVMHRTKVGCSFMSCPGRE